MSLFKGSSLRHCSYYNRVTVEEAYIHCSEHILFLKRLHKQAAWGTDDERVKGGDFFKVKADRKPWQSAAADYLDSEMKDNPVRVYVGRGTKKINGEKKVGDKIRAEITRGGFANSIQ